MSGMLSDSPTTSAHGSSAAMSFERGIAAIISAALRDANRFTESPRVNV